MAGIKIALAAAVLSGCAASEPPDRATPSRTGPTTPAGAGQATPPGTDRPTAPPTVPPALGPTGAAARVALTRSGGIAGRGDTVTVEPDGRWTAVDRAGARRAGRLSAEDLQNLRRLLADPRLAAEAGRSPAGTACRDAFRYRLTVGAVETGYEDCAVDAAPPGATRAVVELLLRVTG
ncbi:hypothetical protein GA0070606_3684 [Micromonospora citrea]|uniref:Uncharacterized protein n=2 Tax=Micromonospora citrea TaxID=47855 RepID=A0A1C6V8T8_9ACTN|nr:hypothetical protein GA0070606_3684 [Micromonospora citrea]